MQMRLVHLNFRPKCFHFNFIFPSGISLFSTLFWGEKRKILEENSSAMLEGPFAQSQSLEVDHKVTQPAIGPCENPWPTNKKKIF